MKDFKNFVDFDKANLAAFIFFIFCMGVLVGVLMSCQTKHTPLRDAEFPCECIYISTTTNAVKFKCHDRGEPYYFVDENYNRNCKVGDILNEPINNNGKEENKSLD